jgi:S-adenosylmethionine decarboxylase
MSKPFGYSFLLDMYDCRPGAADDLELHYRFLEELVDRLGMTRMAPPIVIHAPTDHGRELFPDKAGVSGWVALIESGVQIHSLEPKRFITLDIYSCKVFDISEVYRFAKETFEFKRFEDHFIERGVRYACE